MRVDVIMPQMGESIAEGTIIKWMKKPGDMVERDEPIFEISTDKVDAEIPSPTAGILIEIKAGEGETVEVDSVVAYIETDKDAAAAAPATAAAAPPSGPAKTAGNGKPAAASQQSPAVASPPSASSTVEELRRTRSSPVVRKIAAEHGIDIAQLQGTGVSGRVTKKDILASIESGAAKAAAPMTPGARPAAPRAGLGVAGRREPLSVMRRKIAEHMVMSRRTSAHVTTLFEVDLTHLARQREQKKEAFAERNGVNLTYTPILASAIVQSLREFPVLNASIDGDQVVYHPAVNLGIAVALDWGLIVPVVKRADELNLVGLARQISDLAERARGKKLLPDEVAGGTFTITNPGQGGAQFGTPIINQPQVAILGVGTIEKRAVVINDAIAIRTMCYLSLSFDHRLIDGAVADQFMSDLKRRLESMEL